VPGIVTILLLGRLDGTADAGIATADFGNAVTTKVLSI